MPAPSGPTAPDQAPRLLRFREKRVQSVRRLAPHARNRVGVGVEGERDRGVPEHLLDHLRMRSGRERERGGGVPQVMEARRLGELRAAQEWALHLIETETLIHV